MYLGLSEQELMEDLEKLKSADVDPHSGKLFAYSYHSQGDKLEVVKKFYDKFEDQLPIAPAKERIVQAFFTAFMQENALNPLVFPSLRFVLSQDKRYRKLPQLGGIINYQNTFVWRKNPFLYI